VRHVWYGCCAEQVTERAAEHCAGKHERRVQDPVSFRYDFAGQRPSARPGRSERTPEQDIRKPVMVGIVIFGIKQSYNTPILRGFNDVLE